jgi:beta-glucanase (GH16 family)
MDGRIAIIGVAVLSLGLAACGSGSSEKASPSTQSVAKQAGAAEADAGTPGAGKWEQTWSDEFNEPAGTKPDPAKWGYKLGGDGSGNGERQLYTDVPGNASTDGDGNLAITAIKETPSGSSCWYGACQYTSARIRTANKFSQAYGRFEARVKVPSGRGLWPAFWTIGDDPNDVGWPQRGEIDVMEILGQAPGTVHGSLHGPGYSGGSAITKSYTLPPGGSFADGFHTFAIQWEPDVVRWYVDDQLYETRTPADLPSGTRWVYDHPFSIILNLAVGGNWPGDPDAKTTFPAQMKVDYVRVSKKADAAAPSG